MYVQIRKAGCYEYVYIVESFRNKNGKIGHRTLERLGRKDKLLEKNPNYLEELKLQLKERSEEIKSKIHQNTVVESILKNQSKTKSNIKSANEGFPVFCYGNAILRIIWKHFLKLEYKINYLDKNKECGNDSLNSILYHKVIANFFSQSPANSDGSIFLVGDTFDEQENNIKLAEYDFPLDFHNLVLKFLAEQFKDKDTFKFLSDCNEIFSSERFLDEVKHLIDSKHISIDFEVLKNIEPLQAKTEILVQILHKVIYLVINEQLTANQVDLNNEQVNNAISNALLIPCINAGLAGNQVLYIKIANSYAKETDELLKAFSLTPLLNCQIRGVLSKRLKIKFSTDADILSSDLLQSFS